MGLVGMISNELVETLVPVKEHTAGGVELRKKIEINNVAGQNRAAVLTRGGK